MGFTHELADPALIEYPGWVAHVVADATGILNCYRSARLQILLAARAHAC